MIDSIEKEQIIIIKFILLRELTVLIDLTQKETEKEKETDVKDLKNQKEKREKERGVLEQREIE